MPEINVGQKAVEIVMKYEISEGRHPRNVSHDKTARGYDIESGDRRIEVKGIGDIKNNNFFMFNNYNLEALKKYPNLWLYVVLNVKTKPKMLIYNRIQLAEKLREAKFSFQLEVPLRKKDLEQAISL